jgi:hypothetical protein
MSVMTLEGFVEDGQIRLSEAIPLPERAKVYVVVPDTPIPTARIWSPRLADPAQASEFSMEMTEVSEDEPNAGI